MPALNSLGVSVGTIPPFPIQTPWTPIITSRCLFLRTSPVVSRLDLQYQGGIILFRPGPITANPRTRLQCSPTQASSFPPLSLPVHLVLRSSPIRLRSVPVPARFWAPLGYSPPAPVTLTAHAIFDIHPSAVVSSSLLLLPSSAVPQLLLPRQGSAGLIHVSRLPARKEYVYHGRYRSSNSSCVVAPDRLERAGSLIHAIDHQTLFPLHASFLAFYASHTRSAASTFFSTRALFNRPSTSTRSLQNPTNY